MTRDEIIAEFEGKRNILQINEGSADAPIIAIPITVSEYDDIKQNAKKHKMYRNIPIGDIISIGDPDTATMAEMNLIPFKYVQGLNQEIVKSFYYPPQKGFPTNRNHCIPFEDVRSAWSYRAKILTYDKRYTNIVLIQTV